MHFLLATSLVVFATANALPLESLEQDFVEYSADLVRQINAMNTTWKVSHVGMQDTQQLLHLSEE